MRRNDREEFYNGNDDLPGEDEYIDDGFDGYEEDEDEFDGYEEGEESAEEFDGYEEAEEPADEYDGYEEAEESAEEFDGYEEGEESADEFDGYEEAAGEEEYDDSAENSDYEEYDDGAENDRYDNYEEITDCAGNVDAGSQRTREYREKEDDRYGKYDNSGEDDRYGRDPRKGYVRPAGHNRFEDIKLTDDEPEDEDGEYVEPAAVYKIAMAVVAALVVLVGVTIFTLVLFKKNANRSLPGEGEVVVNQELMGAGAQIAGIDLIGEHGIRTVYNIKRDEVKALELAEAQASEEDEKKEYNEGEIANDVAISLETVTVLKDLKVKVLNKNTGKLLANIPFSVTVSYPDGTSKTWSDDDKDGIIYYTDLKAGKYNIHFNELTDEKYADYALPTDVSAEVKDKIEYKAVDVEDEILDASQVNENQEDTARGGADSGGEGEQETPSEQPASGSTDTVEWVESSTKETYVEVDKSTLLLAAPVTDLGKPEAKLVRTTAEGTGDPAQTDPTQTDPASSEKGPDPLADAYITLAVNSVSVEVGKSTPVVFELTGFTKDQLMINSSDSTVASASLSDDGKYVQITGNSKGSAMITLAYTENTIVSGTVMVTVTDIASSISLGKTSIELYSEKSTTVDMVLTGIESAQITVTSSDDSIATASVVDATKISITAGKSEKGGTATITVAKTDYPDVKASLTVNVSGSESVLKTSDGKEIYVENADGTYRAATYEDYNSGAKLFVKETVYTGWQTIDGQTYYYKSDGTYVTGEQIIQGVAYNFDSKGCLQVSGGVLGIDVSKWNGSINWAKVKESGVNFAIIRIGYRGSTKGGLIDDSAFKANIEGASNAGIKVGVYWVTQAVNEVEAIEEASAVLSRISGYRVSYPVFLDVESSGGRGDAIDKATRTVVCKTFCQTIQNSGYTAGIYANKNWMTNYIDASQLTGYKIWLAQYSKECTYKGSYSMWQYTDSGSISGINGKVDLNLSYLGY